MKNNITIDRIFWIDLLKGLGIILVLLGHFLEPFIERYSIFKILFIFIYSFHMPLFCFLSGLVAKFKKEKIFKYILIFIIVQIMYLIFRVLVMNYHVSFKSIIKGIIVPFWHLWYLEAFIIWNITLIVSNQIKSHKTLTILIAMLISLLSGYIEIPLSLQRVLTFYPFFIFGYLYKENIFQKIHKYQEHKKAYIICLIFILLTLIVIVFLNKNVNLEILFECNSYYKAGYSILDRMIFTFFGITLSLCICLIFSKIRNRILECYGGGGYIINLYISRIHLLEFKTIRYK